VLPLKDENPITRTPLVTVAIILACIGVYFGPQNQADNQAVIQVDGEVLTIDSESSFALEFAAVPCEILANEPLSSAEIERTFVGGAEDSCEREPESNLAFPNKIVWLAALTSMFLHGSIWHLGSNMWIFWIFGNNIEDRLGHVGFLATYLVGGFIATAGHVLTNPDSTIPLVGASGAIAATMGAYLVWHPNAPIRTLVFYTIWDIRARWFLTAWFAFQFFTSASSGVAWVAHVAGFLFGVIFGFIFKDRDESSTGPAGRGPFRHPSDIIHPDDMPYYSPPPK
jgi:membrane associated rhomboid family serine protease